MTGTLKECEAWLRERVEEAEMLFMPHMITTVLEILVEERERDELRPGSGPAIEFDLHL